MTALAYATVVGKFTRLDAAAAGSPPASTPLTGQVTITCSVPGGRLLLAGDSPPRTIVVDPIVAQLDVGGQFSVEVPGTDQPSVTNPSGFTYTATFNFDGVTVAPFSFSAPSGTTVDLTLVAPVAASGGVLTIVGPAGPTGATGPTGPAGAVNSVAAADSTIVIGGSASAPTFRVGSGLYDGADSLVMNVKNHGAVGNGSTDDTTAINNAIAALNPALGGVVYFPPGWYKVSSAISIPNFTTIMGAGEYATIIYTTSTTADVFTSSGTLIGIKNLQIDGSTVTRTAGSAINFTNVTNYTLDHLRIIDCYNAGTFTTANIGLISNILMLHGTGVTHRGFVWKYCVDTHCKGILINGGTAVLSGTNAWLQVDSGCDTFSAIDCGAASSSGSGLCFYLSHTDGASFPPRWVKVTNWWFEGSSGTAGAGSNGVQIDNCLSAYFTNGQVSTSLNGIYITGGRDIQVTQTILQNCWLRGVVVSSAATLNNVTLRDVIFDSNSQGSNNSAGHLLIGGTTQGVRVRDCKFSNQGLGLANKVSYAIENSVAQGQDVRVSGCTFVPTDYATGTFGGSAPTQRVARDNQGYNPVGSLSTPAVPATTVAYTNLFGVDATVHITGGTVTVIAVAGAATGVTSGSFRVPAGSTITLTYTAAPSWTWFGD